MGFGSAFKSAWNKATDTVKQSVAQVATTAKQVVNQAVVKTQEIAQQAKTAARFVVAQTAKAAGVAQQAVKKAAAIVTPPIAKAVEKATQNVTQAAVIFKQNARQAAAAAKQTFNKAENAGQQKISSIAGQVKNAFNKIKKNFSNSKLVKKAVQSCPLLQKDSSLKSKSASALSLGLDVGKPIYDLIKDGYPLLKSMMNAGRLAVKFKSDTKAAAMAKHALRFGKNTPIRKLASGIAFDLLLGGVAGGLDSYARNVDRKDISNANKAGRVAFGSVKGMAQSGLSTAGGAATGAVIGAVIGSVVPGFGTAVGAVAGAKLGAMFLSPLFDVPGASISGWAAD